METSKDEVCKVEWVVVILICGVVCIKILICEVLDIKWGYIILSKAMFWLVEFWNQI